MMRKIIPLFLVAILCMTSVVIVCSEDSGADTVTGTIHPYSKDAKLYYSTVSRVYDKSVYDYYFQSGHMYYTYDPATVVTKYANRESDSLGDYVVYDSEKRNLKNGTEYWDVYYQRYSSDPGDSPWMFKSVALRMEAIYLPSGTYEIKFTSSNMDETRCRLEPVAGYIYTSEFTNGTGTVKLPLTESSSFYVEANNTGRYSTSYDGLDWVMQYTITPAVPEMKTVDCEKTVTTGTNKVWVRYESDSTVSAGTYRLMKDNCFVFAKGSAQEKEFLTNVVDKGLTDTSGYTPRYFELTSSSYVDIYMIGSVGDSLYKQYFSVERYKSGGWTWMEDGIEAYPTVMTKNENYTFYGGQNFSIAVDFDTSEYIYVMLTTGSSAVCMEPKKLYSIKSVTAAEYELYAIMADGSTAPLSSATIKIHTEGVNEPDNYGVIFAVVAILFCAVAFFLLFYHGRRPKWDEMTGLPTSGAEEVINEAPVVEPEEIPQEDPGTEPPKE